MEIELIATYRNEAEKLEVLIMDGNDKHNYRVVCRDRDANETIFVSFTDTYLDCMKRVREFLMDDFHYVDTDAASQARYIRIQLSLASNSN